MPAARTQRRTLPARQGSPELDVRSHSFGNRTTAENLVKVDQKTEGAVDLTAPPAN